MARGDRLHARIEIDFIFLDARFRGLSASGKWLYLCLWASCVEMGRERLPSWFYPKGVLDRSGLDPKTVRKNLAILKEISLIDTNPQGEITVYGVRKKNSRLRWKDSPNGEDHEPLPGGTEGEGEVEGEKEQQQKEKPVVAGLSSEGQPPETQVTLGQLLHQTGAGKYVTAAHAEAMRQLEGYDHTTIRNAWKWTTGQMTQGKIKKDVVSTFLYACKQGLYEEELHEKPDKAARSTWREAGLERHKYYLFNNLTHLGVLKLVADNLLEDKKGKIYQATTVLESNGMDFDEVEGF